jgi:hypothetical protein
MTTTTPQPTRNQTGEPRELARYQADVGERVLIGQRVDGRVRVTDEPAAGTGRRFLIEPWVESNAALEALLADYLEKARRLGYVPMHGWF